MVSGPSCGKMKGVKARRYRKLFDNLTAYAFLGPMLVGLCVFIVGPIVVGLVLSFTHWNIIDPPRFAGLANYVHFLTKDPMFWLTLRNTGYYVVLTTFPGIMVSLGLALALKSVAKRISVLRTLYFIPVIVSAVTIGMVWRWLFGTEHGLINIGLSFFGIGPVGWLTDTQWAMPAVAIVSIWRGMGFNMVIFVAGLLGIPTQLYEAAVIDGAGKWHQFWRITLPLLSPVFLFVLVLTVIRTFQAFDLVYVMTQGGPGGATTVYTYLVYRTAFYYLRMGYGAAMSYILFLIIFAITVFQLRVFSKRVQYEFI